MLGPFIVCWYVKNRFIIEKKLSTMYNIIQYLSTLPIYINVFKIWLF